MFKVDPLLRLVYVIRSHLAALVERRDIAGRVDPAQRAVPPVGDEQVALAIECQAAGIFEKRLSSGTVAIAGLLLVLPWLVLARLFAAACDVVYIAVTAQPEDHVNVVIADINISARRDGDASPSVWREKGYLSDVDIADRCLQLNEIVPH